MAAALRAGLAVLGWSGLHVLTPAELPGSLPERVGLAGVVLVADAGGRLTDPLWSLSVRLPPVVVAVGPLAALSAMAALVDRGVATAVLDADQPIGDLVHALDGVLLAGATTEPRADLSARLRALEREARLFATLTAREQGVLADMLAGRSAAQIADVERVSLATVRSHIRAVLTKLGVSSQLAAVALARRSCREPRIIERMRQVHQF